MPHNGGGKGWVTDPVTGKQTMPDIWRQFLEWLLLGPERMPSTQKEWAAENGTHEDTVRRWKRDPRFRKEWESRAAEMNVHIERVQGVIDAVYSGNASMRQVLGPALLQVSLVGWACLLLSSPNQFRF